MSLLQVGLACSLLRESFGELVEKVGTYLLHNGGVSLTDIIGGTGITQNQVKKSLCVLIQHQLVTFKAHSKGSHMIYHMTIASVLLMVRYPRCIHTGKVLFGDSGELIIEDLLQQGQSLMSQCIQRVSERLEESLTNSGHEVSSVGKIVKQQFIALVEGQFVQRVSPCNSEVDVAQNGAQETGGIKTTTSENKFVLPSNIEAIRYVEGRKRGREEDDAEEEPKAKKMKRSEEESKEEEPDAGIVWHLNFDRFHQYFRDQAIIQAVGERVDSTAACIMRTVLNIVSADTPTLLSQANSTEVYAHQVSERMPPKPKLSREEVEQYLKVLAEDETRLLSLSSIGGGGEYRVDYKRASELLCQATIEAIVRERFGAKAHRIFRLLITKKMLEQLQVAEMAMLPSKEAKEILYTLLAESFVSLQEVPRTPDYAPSRTFYLFTVHLNKVARLLLERCYQTINNLCLKRTSECNDNKRLLDKYEVYERQSEAVGSSGDELEELLTPDEKKRAESVRRSLNKLEHAELQVDESVFIITNYLATHTNL
ncbi:DNA-directed RNA polymerase III subunit RPC3-like isoform X2 [Halichondria panicea]|uniref:DNA-directed RNA polymerase III subunit RPC3-like isoform X2 n=1 Tax=Halichondria panicea TaxID=6063 RepID=UPI00312B9A3E